MKFGILVSCWVKINEPIDSVRDLWKIQIICCNNGNKIQSKLVKLIKYFIIDIKVWLLWIIRHKLFFVIIK